MIGGVIHFRFPNTELSSGIVVECWNVLDGRTTCEAVRLMPVENLLAGIPALMLDVEDPDAMRELTEGTLVEEPDELADTVRKPPNCDVLNEALIDRIAGGTVGSWLISPARSAKVFLLGFAGTIQNTTSACSPRELLLPLTCGLLCNRQARRWHCACIRICVREFLKGPAWRRGYPAWSDLRYFGQLLVLRR